MSDAPRRPYQDVAAKLIDRIRTEGFAPGDKFPTERQISMELGISRSLVREAFIMLEIEGWLDVRKGSGSYVADRHRDVASPAPPDCGPFELLQARQLVESNIAALAATTVTKADILRMRETLEVERRAIEAGEDDYTADRRFHRQIAETTQNSALIEIVESLWARREASSMWVRLHGRIFDGSYRRQWLDDHAAILEALRLRDSESARRSMWQHLENVRLTLLELSDVGDPEFDGYLYTNTDVDGVRTD